jgi:hypothetical protein
MARLRGTGLGAGMAMGAAAVVQSRQGVPLMPEPPPRVASLIAGRRLTEIPDVVLVAEEFRTAAAIAGSISWANVVGITAERGDADAATPSVPAVIGLEGLMRAASDDVLILVDATRGVALVDPDPIYLAQYTAEHDRVAPKNRLYLDDAHQPAQTLDGRTIAVVARTDVPGVEAALATGPDALYHALPLSFDPDDIRRHLSSVAGIAAGKPLIVPYNPSVPLVPLLETASYADVTLVISAAADDHAPGNKWVAAVLDEIRQGQEECAERDVICDSPRIGCEVRLGFPPEAPSADLADSEAIDLQLGSMAGLGVTRLVVHGGIGADSLRSLSVLIEAANRYLLPVTYGVERAATADGQCGADVEYARSVRLLIGAGVSGLMVAPQETQVTKEAVRATTVSECREELSRRLAEAPGDGGTA